MRISKVPIDMSSEQKNIQGILSTRQAIYLGVGGVVLYSYIPILFNLFKDIFSIYTAVVFCLVAASPILIAVGILGFWKVSRLEVFFDRYLMIVISKKTQYGIWRKGD